MRLSVPVDSATLRVIARLDSLRGAWSQGPGLRTDRLEQLRAAATVQSIGSSCRLSGVRLTDADVSGLLRDSAALHPERPVAVSYARAMDWAGLDTGQPLDEDRLRRLHAIVSGGERRFRAEPLAGQGLPARGLRPRRQGPGPGVLEPCRHA